MCPRPVSLALRPGLLPFPAHPGSQAWVSGTGGAGQGLAAVGTVSQPVCLRSWSSSQHFGAFGIWRLGPKGSGLVMAGPFPRSLRPRDAGSDRKAPSPSASLCLQLGQVARSPALPGKPLPALASRGPHPGQVAPAAVSRGLGEAAQSRRVAAGLGGRPAW